MDTSKAYTYVVGISFLLFLIFFIISIVKSFDFMDENYSNTSLKSQYNELKSQMNLIMMLSLFGTVIFTAVSLFYEEKDEVGSLFVSVISTISLCLSFAAVAFAAIHY